MFESIHEPARKPAFFISDVHLREMDSPTGRALLAFFAHAQKNASMVAILGDLFDVWVGSGAAFQQKFAPLVETIRQTVKVCPVVYLEGNHDFLLHAFWQNEVGCKVSDTRFFVEHGSLKLWLEHGDEINADDKFYLALRHFFRSKPFRGLVKIFPSRWVAILGNRASHTSRQFSSEDFHNPEKAETVKGMFRDYARALSKHEDFDFMITGHSHFADDFTFQSESGRKIRLVNLGSWFDGPHYFEIDPACPESAEIKAVPSSSV